MNRFLVTAIFLVATAVIVPAAPSVALVRVKSVYTGLESTATLQKQIQQERKAIMKDERAQQLRRIIVELQGLQARLSDKAKPLDDTTRRKLARSYEIKRQEAQTLQKEFESFRAEQEKEINRKMVKAMRASLDKIVETAEKIAKKKGFDLVFDSSGNTNTGTAFVLYSKESPDLTDDVTAALQPAKTDSDTSAAKAE